MPYTNESKNEMLEQLKTRITDLSLHDGDPGLTGANEISGSGYARAAASGSWSVAAGGEITLTEDKLFSGSADSPITHFGVWDTTTFLGGGTVSGVETSFNAEGEAILTTATSLNLNA